MKPPPPNVSSPTVFAAAEWERLRFESGLIVGMQIFEHKATGFRFSSSWHGRRQDLNEHAEIMLRGGEWTGYRINAIPRIGKRKEAQ